MLRVHEIERSRVAKVGQMNRCLDDVIKRGTKLRQHTLNIRERCYRLRLDRVPDHISIVIAGRLPRRKNEVPGSAPQSIVSAGCRKFAHLV
jgi:hypothetical protein